MTTAIRPQVTSFLDSYPATGYIILGWSDDSYRSSITKNLRQLLISGLPEIDEEHIPASTRYTAASPQVVQWLWEAFRSFNKEDMARLLQFITGTSRVPLEGFRELRF